MYLPTDVSSVILSYHITLSKSTHKLCTFTTHKNTAVYQFIFQYLKKICVRRCSRLTIKKILSTNVYNNIFSFKYYDDVSNMDHTRPLSSSIMSFHNNETDKK